MKEIKIKLILLGDTGVGKSSLIFRKKNDFFNTLYSSTIGVDFISFREEYDDIYMKIFVWDTGGQDKFKNIIKSYFRGVTGVLLIYDITNRQSFLNLSKWMIDLNENHIRDNVMVIGCKADLESRRHVSYEEGSNFANRYGFMFSECSSKVGSNINNIFDTLIIKIKDDIISKKIIPSTENGIIINTTNYNYIDKKGCCNIL